MADRESSRPQVLAARHRNLPTPAPSRRGFRPKSLSKQRKTQQPAADPGSSNQQVRPKATSWLSQLPSDVHSMYGRMLGCAGLCHAASTCKAARCEWHPQTSLAWWWALLEAAGMTGQIQPPSFDQDMPPKRVFDDLAPLVRYRMDGVDNEGCIQLGKQVPEVVKGFIKVSAECEGRSAISVVDPSFRLTKGWGERDSEAKAFKKFEEAGALWNFTGVATGWWLITERSDLCQYRGSSQSEAMDEPKFRESRYLCMFHQSVLQARLGTWQQLRKKLKPNSSHYRANNNCLRIVGRDIDSSAAPIDAPCELVVTDSARPARFFTNKFFWCPPRIPLPEQFQLFCDVIRSKGKVVGIHLQVGGAPVGTECWWQ